MFCSEQLSWALATYSHDLMPRQDGSNLEQERLMGLKYPPIAGESEVEFSPFILIDTREEIGMVHLPGILSTRIQLAVESAFMELRKECPSLLSIGKGPSTRSNLELFDREGPANFGAGTCCLSYCWFQQGHEVTALLWLIVKCLI